MNYKRYIEYVLYCYLCLQDILPGQCRCSLNDVSQILEVMPELKGPPGPQGPTGADGTTGAPGKTVRFMFEF